MLFLKIKKNFQNLFKTLAQKIFIMIYGKIDIDDYSSMQNLKVYDIDNKNINTFFGNDYKIYLVNFIIYIRMNKIKITNFFFSKNLKVYDFYS